MSTNAENSITRKDFYRQLQKDNIPKGYYYGRKMIALEKVGKNALIMSICFATMAVVYLIIAGFVTHGFSKGISVGLFVPSIACGGSAVLGLGIFGFAWSKKRRYLNEKIDKKERQKMITSIEGDMQNRILSNTINNQILLVACKKLKPMSVS